MRNVVIAIAAFIVMLAGMYISMKYLNEVTSNLQKTNDKLEQYIVNEKWEKAYETSMEYTHKWEQHAKLIKMFVNHQEIDNVEIELWKLPQYVKEKTKDEALASVHSLKFLLGHISNLEKVNIQNIL